MRITNVARLNVEVSDPTQIQALATQNIEPVKRNILSVLSK